MVNTPKYDQNAKVFFLIYLGYNTHQQDKLESVTKPLVPVHKKLAGSGAELVMYLDFPPEQKESAAKKRIFKGNITNPVFANTQFNPLHVGALSLAAINNH